jgi:protein gp37
MGQGSSIEWTESTWNPVTGCTKISPGFKHFYAERLAKRLQAMGQANYRNGFEVTLHEHALRLPLTWKRSQMVFVNSMSDLFHERVPASFIQRTFAIMQEASIHTFQVLTKRSERLAELAPALVWPTNVWMGVSVESSEYRYRIDDLRTVPAHVKFLSLEPLLAPLGIINLAGIDWAIVGGESGPGARPVQREWVIEIKDQCLAEGIAFFFKQWGGTNKKKTGRTLDGRTWDGMPIQRASYQYRTGGWAVNTLP